jgi:hypothetical protein
MSMLSLQIKLFNKIVEAKSLGGCRNSGGFAGYLKVNRNSTAVR